MKKKLRCLFIVSLAALLLFSGCDREFQYQEVDESGKQVVYFSLEEMEEVSAVIVECVRLKKGEPIIGRNGDRVMNAYTFSQVEITKIHKDDSKSLKEGDILRVKEYEAYDAKNWTYYYSADYRMMVEGKAYLLFARKQPYDGGGDYLLASGITGGTISLEEDGRTDTSWGQPDSGKSLYESIWKEAVDKYVN